MFLIDKYFNNVNHYIWYQPIIDKLLASFDTHNDIYSNMKTIINKPEKEFNNIIYNLERGVWKYANFQHLVIYGKPGSGKEFLVNKLLENIYGKQNVVLNDIEYTINGYGNSKTKVIIKQSKYHIIIEPNSNGFDKYLIQDIIQNYAKTELLNIIKYKRLFKIIVINKISNLSNVAQASLRRTMEKYSDTCKFIFICDQLTKMIEPLRSRCIEIRVPRPSNVQIINTLLYISTMEKIPISSDVLSYILKNCNNKIHNAIWLLELLSNNCVFVDNKNIIIQQIVNMIIDKNNYTSSNLLQTIKKIRELYYQLSITNMISYELISVIMRNILKIVDDFNLKLQIIDITSVFELRKVQGTRYIKYFEAYIIKLIELFSTHNKGLEYHYNLEILEL
jgi:replication factor C subunit 3/5